MEKLTVFGRQHLDFEGKGGSKVKGVSLHCTCAVPNEYWEGLGYEKLWISADSPLYQTSASLPVPCDLQVEFNRYGKPSSFVLEKK